MQNTRSTVAWRLLGSLAACAVLLFIFSITSIVSSHRQSDAIGRMYRLHVASTVQLSLANDRLWRLRYGFPQYLVMDSEARERILQEEPLLDQEIRKILANYAALPLSEAEREQIGLVIDAYNRYMAARPAWFTLVDQGRLTKRPRIVRGPRHRLGRRLSMRSWC